MQKLPKIALIGTGGTIAAEKINILDQNYQSPSIPLNTLLSKIPDLSDKVIIETIQFSQKISHDNTTKDWINLARFIQSLTLSDIDGIVITHGTNTIEETAYFLNLVIKTDKPIVITGAMRAVNDLGFEGLKNLYNAILLAINYRSYGKGVLVTFNDRIIAARFVEKNNTIGADGISSNEIGVMGYIQNNNVNYYFYPTTKHTINSDFDIREINFLPSIGIIYSHININVAYIKSLITDVKGIVAIGFGAGHYTKEINCELITAQQKNIPVVRISKSWGKGAVLNINNSDKQFISGNNMSPQKAHVLLSLGLSKTKCFKTLQNYFDEH